MPDYRAYVIGEDGRIQSAQPLACDDDEAAIADARQLVDKYNIELRQGARKVTMLPHKPAAS